MEAAPEPSLQVEGSLRAKLTGGGHPSAGGGQTLEPDAQSHQEQRFALHLSLFLRRNYRARSGEDGRMDPEPEAGVGWSLGSERVQSPLKGESQAARRGRFPRRKRNRV